MGKDDIRNERDGRRPKKMEGVDQQLKKEYIQRLQRTKESEKKKKKLVCGIKLL